MVSELFRRLRDARELIEEDSGVNHTTGRGIDDQVRNEEIRWVEVDCNLNSVRTLTTKEADATGAFSRALVEYDLKIVEINARTATTDHYKIHVGPEEMDFDRIELYK